MAILLGCWLRRSEAASLRWSDVRYLDGRMLLDVQGKGGKVRSVPVPEWAATLVEQWRKEQDETHY